MLEIKNTLNELVCEKLEFYKMHIAILDEASRVKIVTRVRGGKIQRRKKLSNVKGYTLRGGKLVRMSAQERLKRKMARRRAAPKIKAKAARALIKRKRSDARRKSLGL